MIKNDYNKKKLYDLLLKKASEIEKIPSIKDINSDPKLPNYQVFYDCFGKFKEAKELEDFIKFFTVLHRKNLCFCNDCNKKDSEECPHDVLECKAKLDPSALRIYFELFDKIEY